MLRAEQFERQTQRKNRGCSMEEVKYKAIFGKFWVDVVLLVLALAIIIYQFVRWKYGG